MTIDELNRMYAVGKTKKIRRHQESDIQSSCVTWFKYAYPRYVIFAVPNGGTRIVREVNTLKNEGMMNGVSDLIIIADHKVLFVEMKTRKGKQRDSQKEFQEKVERLGFKYVICRSLDEFIIAVNGWLGKSSKV